MVAKKPAKTATNGASAAKKSATERWRERLEAAALVSTQTAIASQIGARPETVGRWLTGAIEPTPKMQLRIVRMLPEASAKPPASPPPESRANAPSLAKEGMTGRDRFAAIVMRIEDEIRACGPTVPRNHVAGLYGQLQSAVERLAKADGEGEITVAALLRSKAWGEVEAVILEVLRRHPGAAEELVAALDAVKEGA